MYTMTVSGHLRSLVCMLQLSDKEKLNLAPRQNHQNMQFRDHKKFAPPRTRSPGVGGGAHPFSASSSQLAFTPLIIGTNHIEVTTLTFSGSREVIGQVTIRFPGSHFLYVLHCHQVSISSRFRDTGP